MKSKLFLLVAVVLFGCSSSVNCVPFIVQTLSSNYALVLGGYGPGYEELRHVEVVKHDKVCQNVIRYSAKLCFLSSKNKYTQC